jgi:hypothetical protein
MPLFRNQLSPSARSAKSSWPFSNVGFFLFVTFSSVLINVEIHRAYLVFDRSEFHEFHHSRSLNQGQHRPSNRNASLSESYLTKARRPHLKLDFFIAGFPKCGTTTLLYAFAAHGDTEISREERCSISDALMSDTTAISKIDTEVLAELNQSIHVKRGMKCPNGIKNARSIERLHMHSPGAKVIIGVRHPVHFFQSFYNYRITEHYNNNWTSPIPRVDTLVGDNEWRGVSTDAARFELFLMQLGKTNISMSLLNQLIGRPHMSVQPNNLKIFLYSLEQMEDPMEVRAASFRGEMETFLGLKHHLRPFGRENINHFVAKAAHNETIDICASTFEHLRRLLVAQGKETSKWIRDSFMLSEDVTVANRDHFSRLLSAWSSDPCAAEPDESLTH